MTRPADGRDRSGWARACGLAVAITLAVCGPVAADAAQRVMDMVGLCEEALVAEEIVTPAGMVEGARHEAGTLSIREWRDEGMNTLIVSLLVRRGANGTSGVCDILYQPADAASRVLAAVGQNARALMDARRAAGAETHQAGMSGQSLVVCEGSRAIAHYLDEANLASGLNFKVALLSPAKHPCEG